MVQYEALATDMGGKFSDVVSNWSALFGLNFSRKLAGIPEIFQKSD
jgi:hypothetical protein